MAFDTDTTQLDHLVKAFDFIEGFLQGRSPVLSVADKELLKRTYHANRGLDQAVAIRVVAGPSYDGRVSAVRKQRASSN
jgi:hypothetical protein